MKRVVLLTTLFISTTAPADDADPVDFDERIEGPSNPTYSKLWSGDRFPNDADYQDKIEQARTLWYERSPTSMQAALELLERATRMEPDRVSAYAWLARISYSQQDWERCANALDRIDAIDEKPDADDFKEYASREHRDLARGTCHALAGNYESAIERFTAIVSAGTASAAITVLAKQRLAETLMALGRLEEAIETLEQLFKRRSYDPGLALILAVAYDRNEQTARATEHYAIGKKRDPNFGTLSSASHLYIPPDDEYYFLGLAYGYDSSHPLHLFSVYYFREYLHHAKQAVWARRAAKHLDELLGQPAGTDLRLYGTAGMDEDKARSAIAVADSSLQDCVTSLPRALFRVRITRLPKQTPARAKQKKQARSKKAKLDRPQAALRDRLIIGVVDSPRVRKQQETVQILLDRIGKPMPETDQITAVTECLEQVARTVKLPHPTGGSGTYSMAEFRVIAH